MVGHLLRRCPNIGPILGLCLDFVGIYVFTHPECTVDTDIDLDAQPFLTSKVGPRAEGVKQIIMAVDPKHRHSYEAEWSN